MEELLSQLEVYLKEELELEERLKIAKEEKRKVLDKLLLYINDDTYSTDTFSIRRDYDFILNDKAKEKYAVETKKVSKKLLKDLYLAGEKLEGVEVKDKFVAYKKKSGLNDLP